MPEPAKRSARTIVVVCLVAGLTSYLATYALLYQLALPRTRLIEGVDPDGHYLTWVFPGAMNPIDDAFGYSDSQDVDALCFYTFWPVYRVHRLIGGTSHWRDKYTAALRLELLPEMAQP
jgi:hypothetical protein